MKYKASQSTNGDCGIIVDRKKIIKLLFENKHDNDRCPKQKLMNQIILWSALVMQQKKLN